MSLQLWYGQYPDFNLYGYFVEFCNKAQIDDETRKALIEKTVFGIGWDSKGNFLIQDDGIDWFCRQSTEIREIVEEWKSKHLQETPNLQDALQQLIKDWRGLKSYTDSFEFQDGRKSCANDLEQLLDQWNNR